MLGIANGWDDSVGLRSDCGLPEHPERDLREGSGETSSFEVLARREKLRNQKVGPQPAPRKGPRHEVRARELNPLAQNREALRA